MAYETRANDGESIFITEVETVAAYDMLSSHTFIKETIVLLIMKRFPGTRINFIRMFIQCLIEGDR